MYIEVISSIPWQKKSRLSYILNLNIVPFSVGGEGVLKPGTPPVLFSLCILMVPPSPVFFSSCILMRAIDNTHSPDTVISNTCRARVATLGLQRARRWYAATKAACKYSSYNLLMIISFRFFKRLNTIRKQTGEQLTEY